MATPASLRLRYPEFAGVDDTVVLFWLTDGARFVGDWGADADPGLEAYAAHMMARGKVAGGPTAATGAELPAGVLSFKSGTFSATFSDAAVTADVEGGFKSTRYGQDFLALRRRNAGMFLVGVPAGCA